jgi:hypothetical protein
MSSTTETALAILDFVVRGFAAAVLADGAGR